MRIVSPSNCTRPPRINVRTMATVSRVRVSGLPYATPCSGPTCALWLDPSPRRNRPPGVSGARGAAVAIVGAVRTKTLLMLVPTCQVVEHCWDPVGHAIATYGYLFEGLIQAR